MGDLYIRVIIMSIFLLGLFVSASLVSDPRDGVIGYLIGIITTIITLIVFYCYIFKHT